MSTNVLKRVAIALAVLIVLWGVLALFRGSISESIAGIALPSLNAADVDRVVIHTPTDTVILAKRDATQWNVNGHLAFATAVSDLFEALADTAVSSELVARSASSHARMGVTDSAGRRIRFEKSSEVLADLYVGERGRAWQSSFVRADGSDEVFLVRSRLRNLVDRQTDDWRDRGIAKVEPDSVQAVEVERDGARYVLTRADSTWQLNGEPADSGAAEGLVGEFRDLSASGFPTAAQSDSIQFERPYRRITIRGRTGSTLAALVVDSTHSGIWVRHDSGGTVFKLDQWRLDRLAPADSTLRPAP